MVPSLCFSIRWEEVEGYIDRNTGSRRLTEGTFEDKVLTLNVQTFLYVACLLSSNLPCFSRRRRRAPIRSI